MEALTRFLPGLRECLNGDRRLEGHNVVARARAELGLHRREARCHSFKST